MSLSHPQSAAVDDVVKNTSEVTCVSVTMNVSFMKNAVMTMNSSALQVSYVLYFCCGLSWYNILYQSYTIALNLLMHVAGDTCNGRCGESFQRGRLCSCDPDCVKYNQCCPDYNSNCVAQGNICEIFSDSVVSI